MYFVWLVCVNPLEMCILYTEEVVCSKRSILILGITCLYISHGL